MFLFFFSRYCEVQLVDRQRQICRFQVKLGGILYFDLGLLSFVRQIDCRTEVCLAMMIIECNGSVSVKYIIAVSHSESDVDASCEFDRIRT